MAAITPKPSVVQFGVLELDLKARELRKRGVKVKLQEQPFQVLSVLIEHAGQVVTKEELRQRIWPSDTFVDFDHGMHSAITRLREALGDSTESPRFIETLPRRGYRFIASVKEIGTRMEPKEPLPGAFGNRLRRWAAIVVLGLLVGTSLLGILLEFDVGGARRWLRRQSNPKIQSLAVLPLQNLSGDPAQDYFADGMTDALITDLSQISTLHVISRTSAMHYKGTKESLPQIAGALNVDGIVEGSVARSGNRVRITAQLIHAATDQHLWAETYERDVGDVLRLQGEVAQDIAQQLRAKLTSQQQVRVNSAPRVNPDAYETYLRGRYFWNQRTEGGLWKSIELFQQAISMDPNSALPYTGLADAYLVLDGWTVEAAPAKEITPKAQAAVQRALELDPTLAEAHTALAGLKHGNWDWEGAEAEYRRAIELNPNYSHAHQWYGQLLCERGKFDACLAEAEHAYRLDPLNLLYGADIGNRLYWARRYDEAVAAVKKTLELDPNFPVAHRFLGQVYEQKGMFAPAIAELRRSAELSNPIDLAALGHAYALYGQREKASEVLRDLRQVASKRYVSGYDLAIVYVGLGENDKALQSLEAAYQEHSSWMLHLKVDPRLDPLRGDPRFQVLLQRVGLAL